MLKGNVDKMQTLKFGRINLSTAFVTHLFIKVGILKLILIVGNNG